MSVELIWVSGYSCIDGNKQAEELAREGASLNFIGSDPAVEFYHKEDTENSLICVECVLI